MAIAAGGLIKQEIVRDRSSKEDWDPSKTMTLNIQIFDSLSYRTITGRAPPQLPEKAHTYHAKDKPLYKLWEDKSNVFGGSSMQGLQSVGAKDGYDQALQFTEIE